MGNKKLNKKIGFIGCGNMGRAILDSIIKARFTQSKDVFLYDKKPLRDMGRFKKTGTARELIEKVDVVILAIKPQNLPEFAQEITDIDCGRRLIISLLAGTTLAALEKTFGTRTHIVRTMTNLGLQVQAGATGMCKNKSANCADLAYAHDLFMCSGVVVKVKESLLDTVTAISGSGPAYFFYLTEQLIAHGVKNGLSKKDARMLAEMTARGAARLMASAGETPEQWRKKVSSPGGTTEAALRVLMNAQSQKIFERAINKAIERSKELSHKTGGTVCR